MIELPLLLSLHFLIGIMVSAWIMKPNDIYYPDEFAIFRAVMIVVIWPVVLAFKLVYMMVQVIHKVMRGQ